MEFALDLNSGLRILPKGKQFQTLAADGEEGLSWQGKYGGVYIDGFGEDVVTDGLNEKGLAFEYLYLPGHTQYQDVPHGQASRALPNLMLGHWILSSFATVEEVRSAIQGVYVYGNIFAPLGSVVPLHAVIHDESGASIVIEYTGGELRLFDNEVGVVTNGPTYDWHLNNLRNYVNLSPVNAPAQQINGMPVRATGYGSGLLGLPGDWTPPSRFVRTACMVHYADKPKNEDEAINLAEHILNVIDIPVGLVRGEGSDGDRDYTQWSVIKDLRNRVLFYRTYDDLTLRAVDLKALDLSKPMQADHLPLRTGRSRVDITGQLSSVNQ